MCASFLLFSFFLLSLWVYNSIVGLRGKKFWPALSLVLVLPDKNKSSSSCAVKGLVSFFFQCYFILPLKPTRSFYFIDFRDRWELMLHNGRRMAAHFLKNYKTNGGESAQLDLFPDMCASALLEGRREMQRIPEKPPRGFSNH